MSVNYSESIKVLRNASSELEKIVFDNDNSFITRFCKFEQPYELIHIRFGSETIEFVYLTEEGQHIVDGIKWPAFEEWIEIVSS